jgi:hypothetical protein
MNSHTRQKSLVSKENIAELERGIGRLDEDNDRSRAEKTLQDLEHTLRKCWSQLGISVEELYEGLGILGQQLTCSFHVLRYLYSI